MQNFYALRYYCISMRRGIIALLYLEVLLCLEALYCTIEVSLYDLNIVIYKAKIPSSTHIVLLNLAIFQNQRNNINIKKDFFFVLELLSSKTWYLEMLFKFFVDHLFLVCLT